MADKFGQFRLGVKLDIVSAPVPDIAAGDPISTEDGTVTPTYQGRPQQGGLVGELAVDYAMFLDAEESLAIVIEGGGGGGGGFAYKYFPWHTTVGFESAFGIDHSWSLGLHAGYGGDATLTDQAPMQIQHGLTAFAKIMGYFTPQWSASISGGVFLPIATTGGIEIDADTAIEGAEKIQPYLSFATYWAPGRTVDAVQRDQQKDSAEVTAALAHATQLMKKARMPEGWWFDTYCSDVQHRFPNDIAEAVRIRAIRAGVDWLVASGAAIEATTPATPEGRLPPLEQLHAEIDAKITFVLARATTSAAREAATDLQHESAMLVRVNARAMGWRLWEDRPNILNGLQARLTTLESAILHKLDKDNLTGQLATLTDALQAYADVVQKLIPLVPPEDGQANLRQALQLVQFILGNAPTAPALSSQTTTIPKLQEQLQAMK